MGSRKHFLRERLSVVCSWTDIPAMEAPKAVPTQQAAIFLAKQELSPVRSEPIRVYSVAEARIKDIINFTL